MKDRKTNAKLMMMVVFNSNNATKKIHISLKKSGFTNIVFKISIVMANFTFKRLFIDNGRVVDI